MTNVNTFTRPYKKVTKKTPLYKYIGMVIKNLAEIAKGNPGAYEQRRGEALDWLNEVVRNFRKDNEEKTAKDYVIKYPGNFYLFSYTSELYENKKLKFYDGFPLIMVLENDSKGFLGLNFHLIHPRFRAKILYNLIRYYPEKFFQDEFLRPMNYKILNRIVGMSGKRQIKMAIRRYKWKNLNNIHGLRVLRIRNEKMPLAIIYSTPKLSGISIPELHRYLLQHSQ